MPTTSPTILVTGATGQLGRQIVEGLLQQVPPTRIVVTARAEEGAAELHARGVGVRIADYEQPATLDAALAGIDTLMFVSSSAISERVPQHRNVIEAASRARVGLVAYTSLLHADTSPLASLADEHRATEAMLRASGLPVVLLRNGWYTENYTSSAPTAVAHGAVLGSAGAGHISSAARADYAAAAVAVLTASDDQAGRVYELAGDTAYTLPEYAAELARQSGQSVVYRDLPEEEYAAALRQVGLPGPLADMLADSDVGASRGGLFDDGHQLSTLIGRPTTPLSDSVSAALM